MSASPAVLESQTKEKKKFRRADPDRSQRLRLAIQTAFAALNLWLGAQFYLWVRFYERGGAGLYVPRPAGAEGWLPIAGLMNLKILLFTGHVPLIHPAAMFLLISFLLMSLLAKKAFCSWLCPVGAFSEQLGKLGRKLFRRRFYLPRWIDIPLRGLKYLLLGFFVFFIGMMSAPMLEQFMQTPYGLIADVKMLNFFRGMSETAAIVLIALVALSVLIENFWCRYLCPYGALMGLVSLLSPLKIRRNAQTCIDCGKCAKACPAALPVDKLVQIRTVECMACMACVASCPAEGALQFSLAPSRDATAAQPRYRRAVTPWAIAAILAFIFFGTILFARATNHWKTNVPGAVYQELVPDANQATHPGFE
jgi:polyferredoxin